MKTALAIFLIVLCVFFHKFEGIFTKKYSARYNKGGFIFTSIISFFSMLFFLLKDLIFDAKGLQFEKPLVVLGLISGFCFALASMTMCWVLGHGPYGFTNLISSFSVLIITGYGLLIGETLSFLSRVGILLIVVSLCLVMPREQKNEKTKVTAKWLIVLVFSTVCSATFGILQRQQQIEFSNAFDHEFMIVTLTVSAILLFAVGVIKDGRDLKFIFRYGFLYAAGGGTANGITNFLTLFVYTLVPISFAAPMITGMGIVISFLIARFIFKEVYTRRQYLGVALGCVAVVLYNI